MEKSELVTRIKVLVDEFFENEQQGNAVMMQRRQRKLLFFLLGIMFCLFVCLFVFFFLFFFLSVNFIHFSQFINGWAGTWILAQVFQ